MFRYRSPIQAAHFRELFQGFPGQISMLSYDETGGPLDDPEQEVQGAEVAIFNPTVTGLHRGQDLLQQGPLLRVAVLAGKYIHHQLQ